MITERTKKSGLLAGADLGETSGSLSDLCDQWGIPGWLCSCTALATVMSAAGVDPCDNQTFQIACAEQYQQMQASGQCGTTPPPPPQQQPSGIDPHQFLKYGMFGLAGVAGLAALMRATKK